MTPHVANRRFRALWLLLPLVALALAGCAGARNPSSGWPGLAADGEQAYVAFNQAVYAVSLDNGRELWRFSPEIEGEGGFYATPAVHEDRLYVGGYDGVVVALSRDEGTLVWERKLSDGRIIGGATVAGDLLLVPSADRHLYALDLDDGEITWTFEADGPIWGRPLVIDDRAYLGALDHHLYALNAGDGTLIWNRRLGGALADQPTSLNGLLLTGTFGEALNAIDQSSGEITWSVPTDDWVWGNPVIGDGLAFFGDVSGALYAVDNQGTQVWKNALDGGVAASPDYADGRVFFVTEQGTIFAREGETNDPVWEQPLEARLLADPLVVKDLVLVAALDGESLLTALDIESGAIRWTFQPAEE